ncbi:hypothetical protein [Sutcliffiella horikoshii]|uniref:hypothetical protein n=1 Tax=Sutcliffiella horikoshii TaxID=79883 RepID=UPI001CBE2ECF|nr:hypothetical protein [Sutcliffiella horikoshii]UAL46058.1 hypothetical protein K7887_14100 [Sutcliffiella horikoshii]
MQKIGSMLPVLLLLILAACGNSDSEITQVEAESIVLQHLIEDLNKDKDQIKIKSVSQSFGKYIVEWKIDESCEFGNIQVDDQNGELLEAEESNC